MIRRWLPLKKRKNMKKVTGSIHLIVTVSNVPDALIVAESEDSVAAKLPNTMLVKILKATNLDVKDFAFMNASSDPFVRIRYGKQFEDTKIIEKELNPGSYTDIMI